MAWGGLVLSLFLIFLAGAVLLLSRRWREESGLPQGKVIYADRQTWYGNSDVLYDTELRLAGKPDYLVQQEDGRIVPVELKSGRAPNMPWPGHVLQLMAYCRLVETAYGLRPTHGILQYRDHAYAVDYTAALEADLLDALAEMHEDRQALAVNRDHDDARRCAACGFREKCAQRLA